MNEIKVLFFANLRESAGTKELLLEVPEGITVSEFREYLVEKIPNLTNNLNSALVSVNKEYAFEDEIIPLGAEVAVFPAVSGGGEEFPTVLNITEEELDLNSLLDSITLPTTGAACIFSGMVRAETRRGRIQKTEYLEYESYQEMAEEKMHQVANEIRQKWDTIEGIAIVQRIGRLYPGTPTVLIACTAGHRDTGVFEAARYGIDRLKQIVPIWKKEISPGGHEWVEGDYIPKPGE
jgi:molybdopterin synthase catalytic subunit